MNVLVIPEDFRKDQYILAPLTRALLAHLGKPHAKVVVCKDPLLGGITQALNRDLLDKILERYKGMVDLFLLCVDRDGVSGRENALQRLERHAAHALIRPRLLLAENAWQEVEVWVLAGHELPRRWRWRDIRQEKNPKEIYFLPYAKQRGLIDEPGEGRKTLAEEAAGRYERIRRLCPEDIASLETRVRQWIESPENRC